MSIMKHSYKIYILFLNLICLSGAAQEKAVVKISGGDTTTISRNIYGQFAEHLGRCIYDGITRNGKIRMDIVKALKQINVPVLRWPGGCFADQYHWKDGVGEKNKRPVTINTNWGMVKEDNSFGTDEFISLCRLLHCEPFIAGNVGTGSPQEMKEWVEYLNYKKKYNVSYIGVGNESWGCGGDMNPEYYSSQYKQFAGFLPDYPGTQLKKIACGPYGNNYDWTETVLKNVSPDKLWGISLHYYILPGPWEHKGSATAFSQGEYFVSMKKALYLNELIEKHSAILDKYDPKKTVALVVDEWGIWTDPTPGTNPSFLEQQNSLRDALIAATELNIFNNHADRVKMACLAQTVNVLQSLVLTKGDQMILTPTYYVFDLYKAHQAAKLLPIQIETPYYRNGRDSVAAVNVSASKDRTGAGHISLVNIDAAEKINVRISLSNLPSQSVTGQILTSEKITDINGFNQPHKVQLRNFTGMDKQGSDLVIELPPKSIVMLELR